jgi:hypothetical protein
LLELVHIDPAEVLVVRHPSFEVGIGVEPARIRL